MTPTDDRPTWLDVDPETDLDHEHAARWVRRGRRALTNSAGPADNEVAPTAPGRQNRA